MQLAFDLHQAEGYKSKAQIVRVLTKAWVKKNAYCPNCGHESLTDFANNRPVADFFCEHCQEQFELKSKGRQLGANIVDDAYQTMIERISGNDNPNFYLLTYDKKRLEVNTFLVIPKHFFTPEIIERRPPLAKSTRRAGWVGCTITLDRIPVSGRIFYVKDGAVANKQAVLEKWRQTAFLSRSKPRQRGWLLDVIACLEQLPTRNFTLQDVYAFESALGARHPENRFVRAKIRQQLQVLRDQGMLRFLARGRYEKIEGD